MPGAFMRGRHSAAILQMMGVTDTIAETIDDYVAIAARLANDPTERQALRERMKASEHKVYRDRACITALEDFLDRAAADASANAGSATPPRPEATGKICRLAAERTLHGGPVRLPYSFKILK